MNSIDETIIMSLFAHTQQKVIAQDIFENYNISNPQAVKAALNDAALNDAAWQGFIAGLEACQRYYEKK